jgi:hypothetical protein
MEEAGMEDEEGEEEELDPRIMELIKKKIASKK